MMAQTLSSCLVRFKSSEHARLRVVCFPYAGGQAVAFHPWAALLPDDVELWSVQYRGRGYRFREAPLTRMDDVLDELEPVLSSLCEVPTVFFGHSMGAMVAFELSRRLVAADEGSPVHLYLSACGPPRHGPDRAERGPEPSDAALLQRLQDLAGTPDGVFEQPDLLRAFLPNLKADLRCLRGWHPGRRAPLPLPITVFGGLDDPFVPVQALDEWRLETSATFRRKLFQGHHFFIKDAYPDMLPLMLDDAWAVPVSSSNFRA